MKKFIVILFVFTVVLVFSIQANAALQTIGTATYGGSDYNLIYDNDFNITWLDYSNAINNWDNQVSWASGLNTGGVLTYNFNAGVSMSWSDDWRLPTIVDGPYVFGYDGTTTAGYNITTSEMGHLFYTELGNTGYYDTSGNYVGDGNWGLNNTGDFQNLQTDFYWSGTEVSANPGYAWGFLMYNGHLGYDDENLNYYAIAVRPGLAVVPEPMSMVLFGVGGVVMAVRRKLSRRRHG